MRPARRIETFVITLPGGKNALYVGDSIRESDPPAVREGIARRRLVATEGRCPCGATSPFDPSVVPPVLITEVIEHESDCPAADVNLLAAIRKADRR
jgi:hypothetical protein